MVDIQYPNGKFTHTFSQIEQAKQEWESTADSLSAVVCLLDKHAQILRANRAIESWRLGQVRSIKGVGLHALFHPGCRDTACYLNRFVSQAWQVIRHDEAIGCEAWDRVLQRNLNVQLRPVFPKKERPVSCVGNVAVGVISDITAQKQIEHTRHLREQEYHDCFEQLPVAIAIWRQSRVLFVNSAFAVMFDYTPEELYGMNLLELFSRRDRESAKNRLSSLPSLKGEGQWKAVGLTRQGRKILLKIEQVLLMWHGQSAFLLILKDKTAQILREVQLKKDIAELQQHCLPFNPLRMRFHEAVEAFEKHLLDYALTQNAGHQAKTCDMLQIPPKTLYRKMRKYGLKEEGAEQS